MFELKSTLKCFSAIGLICVLLTGCGEDEPDVYHVSGTVTFDGKPIPQGKIYFMPDNAKGNNGVTGFADIKEGAFDTKLEGGKGHPSGDLIVKIEGFDPNAESADDDSGEKILKSLFPPYEMSANLPKEASTKDFAVPAEAADRVITDQDGKRQSGP